MTLKAKIEKLESDMLLGTFNKDAEKYEELLRRFDLLGGYVYQKEYNTAIKKFGFSEEDKRKPLKEFSGGQRTKIALIKLLLGRPDLLILDEPTNNLDAKTVNWLENFLIEFENLELDRYCDKLQSLYPIEHRLSIPSCNLYYHRIY